MDEPRVVHLINSLGRGGAERLLCDLHGHWDRVDEAVIALLDSPDSVGPEADGDLPARWKALGLRHPLNPLGWRRVERDLAGREIHVLHTHLMLADVLGRRHAQRHPPVQAVTTLHSPAEHYLGPPHGRPGLLQRLYARVARSTPGAWVGVSEQVAESFRSHPRWHAPVRVIENGVHLPRVAAHADGGKALRSNLCVPPGGVVLATVARLVPSKGHEVLLEALARIDLPSILSCWAGDGPLRRPLERRARELGLSERVHFVGTLADVGPLLAAADVFVLPSLREGLPLALLEALAMARPVITTHASGIGERINAAEAGVVLEPGDPVALADAIVRLAGCPGLRERMGRGAAALAEAHFSARRCASDYQDLYEELLADGSAMH